MNKLIARIFGKADTSVATAEQDRVLAEDRDTIRCQKLAYIATLTPEQADEQFPDTLGEGFSFADNGFRARMGLPLI